MESGAASNPACRRIAGVLLDFHAGWTCENCLSERLAPF